MYGERIMWALVLYAAGFASAVIVGARKGEQVSAGVADVLDTCDELARADRVDCKRCVLAVPPGDDLRVARMPRAVTP